MIFVLSKRSTNASMFLKRIRCHMIEARQFSTGTSKWKAWKLDVHTVSDDFVGKSVGITAPLILPWGFLTRNKVHELVQPCHETSIHTRIQTPAHPDSPGVEKLLELANGKDEICRGVLEAYSFVSSQFMNLEVDWAALDVASPRLSGLLSDVCSSYLSAGVSPKLDIVDSKMTATVMGIWMEEGSVDKPNKVLGMYDVNEIKYHLLSGFFPAELSANAGAENFIGASPRRLVVAVRIESLESFNIVLGPKGSHQVKKEPGDKVEKEHVVDENTETETILENKKEQVDENEEHSKETVNESEENLKEPGNTKEENVDAGELEDIKQTEEPLHVYSHFWVIESDLQDKQPLQWRIRNINDAICAEEGEKIPY